MMILLLSSELKCKTKVKRHTSEISYLSAEWMVSYLFINRFYLIEFSFYDTKLYRQGFMLIGKIGISIQIPRTNFQSHFLVGWLVLMVDPEVELSNLFCSFSTFIVRWQPLKRFHLLSIRIQDEK